MSPEPICLSVTAARRSDATTLRCPRCSALLNLVTLDECYLNYFGCDDCWVAFHFEYGRLEQGRIERLARITAKGLEMIASTLTRPLPSRGAPRARHDVLDAGMESQGPPRVAAHRG